MFLQELDIWGIKDKYITVVHDEGRNINKAMIESLGNNVLCCAHTLQLCVTKALKNDEIFKLLKIIRSTVGHFKHSTTTNAFIEKYQTVLLVPEHQLIQDVATRIHFITWLKGS